MVASGPAGESREVILRRVLDIISALIGLSVLSPLLIGIAAAIKLDDGGPILYKATRVGLNGQLFHLYKFRTMRVGADRLGPGITALGDGRVTRVGRWLRRTKLDELPQLINVLAGDMGLVGPRPEDPRYVMLYTPAQRKLLRVRPGITGAASLAFRNEERLLAGEDWEQIYRSLIMPAKLAIDLEYLLHRSLWSDIVLVVRTVTSVLS